MLMLIIIKDIFIKIKSFKTMIYGEMKVDQDVNGGHPLCKGEDYRNGKMIWKDSLVTAGKAYEKLYSISYH